MKKLFYIISIATVIIIGYSIIGGDNRQDYINATQSSRDQKIDFLTASSQSPFKQFNIPFKPLEYFEISPEYNVRAKLERITTTQQVILKNSDSTSNIYKKFAFARFKLKDHDFQLLILKATGFGSVSKYFTAFADKTSGVTTYGGGRYLDLEIGKSDNIIIDFNLAYNPYCAYAPKYSCPLPPAENILNIAIEAGEKDYKY